MGPETRKFIEYLQTAKHFPFKTIPTNGIDIGFGGNGQKLAFDFVGYDQDSPGFDRTGKMPFADEYFSFVYSSHCLEHIVDYKFSLREWFRILKTDGYMLLLLPHKFLYEKKEDLPSRYNTDHKRFYTPASFLKEVEDSLKPNTYRVRLMEDLDAKFDYSIPPEKHSQGNYSILLILQKITPPTWEIK